MLEGWFSKTRLYLFPSSFSRYKKVMLTVEPGTPISPESVNNRCFWTDFFLQKCGRGGRTVDGAMTHWAVFAERSGSIALKPPFDSFYLRRRKGEKPLTDGQKSQIQRAAEYRQNLLEFARDLVQPEWYSRLSLGQIRASNSSEFDSPRAEAFQGRMRCF